MLMHVRNQHFFGETLVLMHVRHQHYSRKPGEDACQAHLRPVVCQGAARQRARCRLLEQACARPLDYVADKGAVAQVPLPAPGTMAHTIIRRLLTNPLRKEGLSHNA